MTRHSTSPPCRNLVDSLPRDCHTKTIVQRARLKPRTRVEMTMKLLFWIRISPISRLGSAIIVLDNVSKIQIELIKQRNDNVTKKVLQVLEISKISKIQKNKKSSKDALLLYELSEREPGWQFTAPCHVPKNTKTIAQRARVEPRRQVHVTMKKLF